MYRCYEIENKCRRKEIVCRTAEKYDYNSSKLKLCTEMDTNVSKNEFQQDYPKQKRATFKIVFVHKMKLIFNR